MFNIRGKLVDNEGNEYIGHQILASFLEKLEIEEPEEPEDVEGAENRPSNNETRAKVKHIWKPSEQRTEITAGGRFAVQLPEKSRIKDPVSLRVVAPDGQVLAHEEHSL